MALVLSYAVPPLHESNLGRLAEYHLRLLKYCLTLVSKQALQSDVPHVFTTFQKRIKAKTQRGIRSRR